MSYFRKQYDKEKLKKLSSIPSRGGGSYFNETKGCYVRYYMDFAWARYCKKQSKKCIRRYMKRNNIYTKKAYDLWWNID